jgi:hypothetical protein
LTPIIVKKKKILRNEKNQNKNLELKKNKLYINQSDDMKNIDETEEK